MIVYNLPLQGILLGISVDFFTYKLQDINNMQHE